MNTESEYILEDKLISQLVELGYESVRIDDEAMMLANLKTQLEIHNQVRLTDAEFNLVLNHLNHGSVYDRAHILRDQFTIKRDGARYDRQRGRTRVRAPGSRRVRDRRQRGSGRYPAPDPRR